MELTNNQIIIAIAANLFGGYIICIFMRAFFGQKGNNQYLEWVSYVGYALVISLLYFFWNTPNVLLIGNTVMYLILTYHYQGTMKARLIAVIMIGVIRLVAETFVLEFLQWQEYGNYKSFNDAQYLLAQVLVGLFAYLTVWLFKNTKQSRADVAIPLAHWVALTMIPIFISMPLATYGRIVSPKYSTVTMIMTIFLFIAVIAIFYLYNYLLQSYQDKVDKELLLQQNNAYSKQLELIDESNTQTKQLRHDWKQHIHTIEALLAIGDIQETRLYIKSMLENIDEQSSQLAYSGNAIVDAILNLKIAKAKRENIDFRWEIQIPEKLSVTSFDLNVILSNLLDNAIEATEQKTSQRWIELSMCYRLNMIELVIKNPYNMEPVKQGGYYVTSKADKENHGQGLKSVHRTLYKYSGSDMDITLDQGEFIVKVYLYDQSPEKRRKEF